MFANRYKNSLRVTGIAALISATTVQAAHLNGLDAGSRSPQVLQTTPLSVLVADPDSVVYGETGFAWNLDNVDVVVTDASGNPVIPADAARIGVGNLYVSNIKSVHGETMATLVAKDPPVGDPPGLRIVNNDTIKVHDPDVSGEPELVPLNCIQASSYLDYPIGSGDFDYEGDGFDADASLKGPIPVVCTSPFQTHKRFKVLMLPSLVDMGPGLEDSYFMRFDVVDGGEATDYLVRQKINNWTGGRLSGFKLEMGFIDRNGDFRAFPAGGPSLEIDPDATKVATFAHGLFGPADGNFPDDGFFSDATAGFVLTATATSLEASGSPWIPGSRYRNVLDDPDADDQFGDWLNGGEEGAWLPMGVFWDFDDNDSTDDELVAWWGWNPVTGDYEWMYGQAGGFAAVPLDVRQAWESDDLYYIGPIDDLANLNLTYTVKLPASMPLVDLDADAATPAETADNFALRVTPEISAFNAPPGYVETVPEAIAPSGSDGSDDGSDTGDTSDGGGGGGAVGYWFVAMLGGLLAYRRRVRLGALSR